jgi:general stress protein 26
MADTDLDRVWDMMKSITICFLSTRDGEEIRARPMSAYVRREENAVYFLADARQHKDEEIQQNPNVSLAFAKGQDYVAVTGRASVSNDRAKIKQLFGPEAKAYWDSPDDPNIRILKVTPHDAEYWDNPGKVVSTVKMAVAAVTGERPDLGTNRKVAM